MFPLAKLSFPCDLVSPPSWHSVLLFLGALGGCRLFYLLLPLQTTTVSLPDYTGAPPLLSKDAET